VRDALDQRFDWELVLVDDGSRDATFDRAREQALALQRVRVTRLSRNYGQTTAMQAGFDAARGQVVVTMDGDLQNDPLDIPSLVDRIRDGYDLVVGYRRGRSESLVKRRLPSWTANRLIQGITRIPIRDNGCTLKAFRREVLRELRLYSDMHRFIPALVAGTTSTRIAEVPVRHHPRRFGRSKYGLSRVWKVLTDLLTVMMIRWFRERPLIMFAWGAFGSFLAGTAFLVAALTALMAFQPVKANAMILPGSALLWFGLAGYLLMLGLVSEVAVREAQESSQLSTQMP
jgi:glycosyltransferase involved in cell wall biosynthesis